MKARRTFLKKLGAITAMLSVASASKAGDLNQNKAGSDNSRILEGEFFHMVFFWLVDDTPEVKNHFLKELKQFIGQVEEIKKVHIGPPASTNRDVIDNTYSINLLLSFNSKKEHDIYQEHPAHKRFIENASSLWKKVLVYDSVK
jgi:Stress responsive A/B Barrel Domain